jgi:hypothetical protein
LRRMSEDKPASKGPVTIMKGGTNSSEFDRLIAAKKLEADRRRAASDADRKVASVPIAQGGAMLRELDMGSPKRNLVGVVQLVNTAGTHERFMQVDIVDGESNGQIIRTIVLVCPLCIERGLPQDQAQISIRDDHRKWYLDERTRGQVFTDPSTLQVYALAGTIVAPGPYRCSAYNCGHRSFRIDPKSDYPGVSRWVWG